MRSPVGGKEEPAGVGSGEGDVAAQPAMKKGPWTAAEDAILLDYVRKHGEGNWNAVQKNSGLQRCGKSCRLRWANHLRPNLKKGSFSPEEEALILQLHARLGNKWARMAAQLPGRTDNEIKNYWNTRIKRRQRAGLPLYPPEIQRQLALRNQKQGLATSPLPASLLDSASSSPTTAALPLLTQKVFSSFVDDPTLPRNFRVNNTLSFQFPLTSVSSTVPTLFPNAASAHYLFENCDLTPPTPPLNSRAYSEKAELPSTQLFTGSECGKRPRPTLSTGQGNGGLLESLLQESQGDGDLFKEGLCLEPLPPSCSKCLAMDSLCKIGDSLCSNEILLKEAAAAAAEQSLASPRVINHDISIHLETIPARTTEAPTAAAIPDWCDGGGSGGDLSSRPSPVVGNADLGSEMQQLASTLSMAHDWAFGSCAWDNMPGIC